VENEKLKLIIEEEMQVYLNKIGYLQAQGGITNAGPHNAKLNYCHGRFEGLQWVLSKISQ
jgi:hypothetical protein